MKRPGYFLLLSDLAGCLAALWLAYWIRFEGNAIPSPHFETFVEFLPIVLGLKILCFAGAGLYRRLWRHAGMAELERLVLVNIGVATVVAVLGIWALPRFGFLDVRVPISVVVLDAALTQGVVAGPRLFFRWFADRRKRARHGTSKRVVIAGAGAAGEMIARAIRSDPALGLYPIGFVDDDPAKHGHSMGGLKVLGSVGDVAAIRARNHIDEMIVAFPSAPGSAVRAALTKAEAAGIRARTVPGMFEILSGRASISSLRPIQIEDLLRREPVRTDLDLVSDLITERTVMITGAGGSIGSELCRQIAALGPARLLVLGHGENSIFNITAQLNESNPRTSVVPLIADVRNRQRIDHLVSHHRPSIVFHAAAHKHVPLMELNLAEAITNNVLGTRNVAEAAAQAGVERMVLISTDKAVRPTSAMGATKRVAEQVVQAIGENHGVPYISVRFGNVLGSRGSVVPTFLRQIQAGGPVTVTHPEMRRYFMTIPEAVQLVLQSAVIGTGSDVFVLDMGEPVKIADLAADLIRLSGLELGRDIEIRFTGVRPGEKLYEELFFSHEQAEPTEHLKILRARHIELAPDINPLVEELVVRAEGGESDEELRSILQRLVPDYQPEASPSNIASGRSSQSVSAAVLARDPNAKG